MATSDIRGLSHPFYRALERVLQAEGFDDDFAEGACRAFTHLRWAVRAYPRSGVRVGAGAVAGLGFVRRQDTGGGFHDAGSQRGATLDRAPRRW